MDQVATEILIVMIGMIKNEKIMIGTKSELRRNIYERIIYIILWSDSLCPELGIKVGIH
jgi:hypothetical protein